MDARTKIVATIGPASESEEILKKIILDGVDVARLNFSHNSHEWHGKIIDRLRKLSNELNMPIGIMADLQGPRIRTVVQSDVEIKTGDFIIVSDIFYAPNFQFPISNFQTISNDQISNDKKINLDVNKIVDDIEVGNEIMIQDGLMKVVVREKNEGFLLAEVINGGTIGNHKGVNLPDSNIKLGALTEKDLNDLKFVLGKGVDFVAMSFVKDAADLRYLREKIKELSSDKNASVQIIPKVERKEALKNIDEIIDESDVVMVARGDLGIEMPESEVVIYQKEIVNKCREKNKPVIVATQMMESMMENPIPTRAEVSDISNAVIDHADFVMLSGESANGKYPAEAVKMMEEIIEKVEKSPLDD
ncbi:MAG TPA: pyruvate kinase [Candidatus Moranbacteria bacterium]|nr:pyruvate kinase [Candidatus Moranbacteria bacterium]